MADRQRIRVGIDVGGTFTKAVAIDARTGAVVSKSTVPTTHKAEKGVSKGIVQALSDMLEKSGIGTGSIGLISHSTTQAINALLESDTSKVGIIAMGVGPSKKDVTRRTDLHDLAGGSERRITSFHEFLDTSHLIAEDEVAGAIGRLRSKGAQVIVAAEAFAVDDPSNEQFVMGVSAKCGIPSTASHEISGVYGLEIRTLTAAINASVLPKTFQVADYVEDAVRETGVTAPLMIMKGDGGVSDMDIFRTRPIMTVLSGPAASVTGALFHLRVTNGIFVEVGGTSTNVCIIKDGRPEIRYVTVHEHPTCIRSMDVRILGVAGGSMVSLEKNRVSRVGPRSAHIADLKYACFADPEELKSGRIVRVRPGENDAEYVAIRCGGGTYAVTNTCAANALEMVEPGDYSFANQESAKVALKMLGGHMGVPYHEAAQSVIQTASFQITRTIAGIMKEFKLDSGTKLIGGGGGASVLVPFVAKQLGLEYEKAEHADVISSIGVASSMLHEEMEQTMGEATPERIAEVQKRAHSALVRKGAVPESIVIDSRYIPEKALLRVTAVGNVELDSAETSKSVFTPEDAKRRSSEIMGIPEELVEQSCETDHHLVFTGRVELKKLFGRKSRRRMLVLDRYGRPKLSLDNGRVFQGKKILEDLDEFLRSRHSEIAPKVFFLNDLRLVDYSGLTSPSKVADAVRKDLASSGRSAVIAEV